MSNNYEKTKELIKNHKEKRERAYDLITKYKIDKNRDYEKYEKEVLDLVGHQTMETFKKTSKEYALNKEEFITSTIILMESFINESLKIYSGEDLKLSLVLYNMKKLDRKGGFVLVVDNLEDKGTIDNMLDLVRFIFGPQVLNYNVFIIDEKNVDQYKDKLFTNGYKEPTLIYFDLNAEVNPVIYQQGYSLNFDGKES